MGRSSNDYFIGLEYDSKMKTHIWTYASELKAAEARIKELEEEIKRLKEDDIT